MILTLLFPTTKRGVTTSLGVIGNYRRFIHKYALASKPLIRFLKDDDPLLEATSEALKAFERLKQKLLLAPILRTPY